MKKKISNWSNYPVIKAEEIKFDYYPDLKEQLQNNTSYISRGMGRCYGDASLCENIISTLKYNHLLEFDQSKGIINCQSGTTLEHILEFVVPKGWFLPVTPGTKYITIGGAVASDVHGKNHHKEGSFSNFIIEMDILLSNGEVLNCSPTNNADLFASTCGGMGLTGIILNVKFSLKKIETAYISQTVVRAKNLDGILSIFQEYKEMTYSMAWIDCLKEGDQFGRSVLFAGEHAGTNELTSTQAGNPLQLPRKKKLSMPFDAPSFVLNPLSVKAFNYLYYHKNSSKRNEITDYDTFFYPLDAILHWNRMYGKNGFLQYQFVLPMETSKKGLIEILQRIGNANLGSFLAVLKQFGKQDSLISFPMEGLTLALDFPVKRGLFEFLKELDKIVIDFGGRIYLSKDARMEKETFWKGYPNAALFLETVKKYNSGFKFQSLQSKRLSITV